MVHRSVSSWSGTGETPPLGWRGSVLRLTRPARSPAGSVRCCIVRVTGARATGTYLSRVAGRKGDAAWGGGPAAPFPNKPRDRWAAGATLHNCAAQCRCCRTATSACTGSPERDKDHGAEPFATAAVRWCTQPAGGGGGRPRPRAGVGRPGGWQGAVGGWRRTGERPGDGGLTGRPVTVRPSSGAAPAPSPTGRRAPRRRRPGRRRAAGRRRATR